MTVFDSFGYCRIGNTLAARKPIRRISRLTTTARTGRLMKISVKAITNYPGEFSNHWSGLVFKTAARLSPARPLGAASMYQYRGGFAGIGGVGSVEIVTGDPDCSLSCPTETTRSPSFRPLVISA